MPQQMKFIFLKTTCNGWTTSHRANHTHAPCILCHLHRDSQVHYLQCPTLWHPIITALNLPDIIDPLTNMTLNNNTHSAHQAHNRYLALYTAYHAYHHLKNLPQPLTTSTITNIIKNEIRITQQRLPCTFHPPPPDSSPTSGDSRAPPGALDLGQSHQQFTALTPQPSTASNLLPSRYPDAQAPTQSVHPTYTPSNLDSDNSSRDSSRSTTSSPSPLPAPMSDSTRRRGICELDESATLFDLHQLPVQQLDESASLMDLLRAPSSSLD